MVFLLICKYLSTSQHRVSGKSCRDRQLLQASSILGEGKFRVLLSIAREPRDCGKNAVEDVVSYHFLFFFSSLFLLLLLLLLFLARGRRGGKATKSSTETYNGTEIRNWAVVPLHPVVGDERCISPAEQGFDEHSEAVVCPFPGVISKLKRV